MDLGYLDGDVNEQGEGGDECHPDCYTGGDTELPSLGDRGQFPLMLGGVLREPGRHLRLQTADCLSVLPCLLGQELHAAGAVLVDSIHPGRELVSLAPRVERLRPPGTRGHRLSR